MKTSESLTNTELSKFHEKNMSPDTPKNVFGTKRKVPTCQWIVKITTTEPMTKNINKRFFLNICSLLGGEYIEPST